MTVSHWNLYGMNMEYFYVENDHGNYLLLGAIRRWMLKTNAAVENIHIGGMFDEKGKYYAYAYVIHSGTMTKSYRQAVYAN